MLRFFSRFTPLSAVLLYALNWLLKLKYVIFPNTKLFTYQETENGLLQFPGLLKMASAHPAVYTIVSMHIIYFLALWVNHFCVQEKLYPKSTFLPALSVVVVSSLMEPGFLLSVYVLLFALLLLALQAIYSSMHVSNSHSKLFRAGMLMSIAVMIKPIFIIVAGAVLMVITIVKSVQPRYLAAYLLGLLFPIFCFASGLWMLNAKLLSSLNLLYATLPEKIICLENIICALIAIFLLVFHGYTARDSRNESGGINSDKKWLSLRFVWLSLLICAVFAPVLPSNSLFIWLQISAVLISPCFNSVLNTKWATFSFVCLLLVVLTNQYVFFY